MLGSVGNGADIPEVSKIVGLYQQQSDGTYIVNLQSYKDVEDVRKALEAYKTWKKNQLVEDRIKLDVAKDDTQHARNAFAQMTAAQDNSEKANSGHPIRSSYFNGSSGK